MDKLIIFLIILCIILCFIIKNFKNMLESEKEKNYNLRKSCNEAKEAFIKEKNKNTNLQKSYNEAKEAFEKEKEENYNLQKYYTETREAFEKQIYKKCEMFLQEKSKAYPYLINKISDFLCADAFLDTEIHLSSTRKQYRLRGQKLREYTNTIKDLTKENLALKYQIEDLISLYPDIENDIIFDNIIDTPTEDTSYLSREEWNTLSDTEKNQLILDRYIENHKKSNWEIGSLFELYIGSIIEARGYSVEYFGIEKKIEDLGRDLVVKTKNEIYIIQCKYWNKHKVIREKHLCQLFGTATSYMMEQPNNDRKKIIPVFVCHNELSETAKKMANYLGIRVYENIELKPFPMIKCNLETLIYHLPVDDNYWAIMTEKTKEKFVKVLTVEEAESLGCRRAFKHHFNK